MSRPAGAVRTRDGAIARKRFGQHYLVDRSVVQAIVRAIDPRPGQRVVEIGPGTGALTAPLLEALAVAGPPGAPVALEVVEIDRDLAGRVSARFGERVLLHRADALAFDFASAPGDERPLRIVGNLPYNISSPLLLHLAQWASRVRDQHFMLQREVVQRIVAAPGPHMGRLTVALQNVYEVVELFDVPPTAFDPPPKVESAVIRMLPRVAPLCAHQALLGALLGAAFGQRRKMLRNTLAPWLARHHPDADLADMARRDASLSPLDDPTIRAEQVPVGAWCALANALAAAQTSRSISSIL
ncbi:MAG: 16S rRNA (adenine(1518)-N(6)/adenine(1519)-N(6))-dimethyltransferase RsmA [Lautropia sp.]